ncbi:hypothetical protein [Joostella sp. CR20]|uniref:hypothetical protein n=1 Tax=Joostella sp. CR20 TaxID=2804312 RepID=UPI00313D191F
MRRFFFLVLLIAMASCDDGDFIIETLEFDDTEIGDACALDGVLTLYKISENKNEALIMKITSNTINFTSEDSLEFTINNNTNKVLYRAFDNEVTSSYFCQTIPPTAPLVTQEWYAPSGTIRIVTKLENDDEDGIPSELEGVVYNEDGTVNDAESQDSDGDGIPDYIDRDDDDDNVLTSEEIDFNDNNEIIFIDTDGDGIPNYLDNNDDNDDVLTIDEDINGDGKPENDTTVIEGEKVPNYLTTVANTKTTDVAGRNKNEYYSVYTTTIKIVDGFKLITDDSEEIKFDLDEYIYGEIIETETNTEN